jgi:antitoxin component YwqK of YwqJK toxin-antitoxin module
MKRSHRRDSATLLLVGALCFSLACASAHTPGAAPEPVLAGTDATNEPPPPLPSEASEPTPSTDPTPNSDASSAEPAADGEPAKVPATQAQAQRKRQNAIARRAEAGLESLIVGTVIGAQLGAGVGALIGAATFGIYGVITGDVPFESGRRSAPADPRAAGSDDQMGSEVEEEVQKQKDLEAEIEAELKRQEDLLAAINKQEETNKTLEEEAHDCAGAVNPSDPTAAPARPCQRDIPDSIFETETKKTGKQEQVVKTLDADRDGRPEIQILIDPKSGQTLSRSEDTDYDGTLDAKNTYQPDGLLDAREEDTNQDGKPDRWLQYDGQQTATRVEVDRNFDGTRDGFFQYQAGVLIFEEHDTNGDGKVDRRVEYVVGKRNVEIEDGNHDGVMDARTYFDASGVPTRIERDKNQDGKTDVWEFFEGADATKVVIVRKEEDKNGDGSVDITSYYENGKLVRKEVSDPSVLN